MVGKVIKIKELSSRNNTQKESNKRLEETSES